MVIVRLTNGSDSFFDLEFELLNNPVAPKWLAILKETLENGGRIYEDKRFYGFPNPLYTKEAIVDKINELVATINEEHPGFIDRTLDMRLDQDDLNYLHGAFTRGHGRYGQHEANEIYGNSSPQVQRAIDDLNIYIHRAESFRRGDKRRFVTTFKPAIPRRPLTDEDMHYFCYDTAWGLMRLNYCEIGKTILDLYKDDDHHMQEDDFIPQKYYSSDFNVVFWDYNEPTMKELVREFYYQHHEYFKNKGYPEFNETLALGYIPLAQLVNYSSKEEVEAQITQHQIVHEVLIK